MVFISFILFYGKWLAPGRLLLKARVVNFFSNLTSVPTTFDYHYDQLTSDVIGCLA